MAPSAAAKGKGKARATHGDNDDGIDDVIRTAVRRIPQPVPTHVMAKSRGPVKEASFDRSKRREFLTGFHKRKKAKHDARVEKAKLREREERSELRRYLREQKKEQARKNVEAARAVYGDEERIHQQGGSDVDEESEGSSQGGEDDDDAEEAGPVTYDHDDFSTSVTVEPVSLSRSPSPVRHGGSSSDDDDDDALPLPSGKRAQQAALRQQQKQQLLQKQKKRKQNPVQFKTKMTKEQKAARAHGKKKDRMKDVRRSQGGRKNK